MVRRVVFNQLLHSLLSLLLVGLFLGGSTAGYCRAKQQHNGSAACAKKTDRLEQFARFAPAAEVASPAHALKFPVFAFFLSRKTGFPTPGKPTKPFGHPVRRDTYLASILVHYIVKNAP